MFNTYGVEKRREIEKRKEGRRQHNTEVCINKSICLKAAMETEIQELAEHTAEKLKRLTEKLAGLVFCLLKIWSNY